MKKINLGIITLLVKILPKLTSALGKIFSVLAKLLKGVKVGKVGLAAASFGAYTYLFTWEFALIIIALIFIHESGHVWAMQRSGMKTRGIYFIPLLGGAAVADEAFPSRKAESYIAIMGPIWGLGLTVICFVSYLLTRNPFFAATAAWMALVNLFNLLPINPLDGGRILKSIMFSISTKLGLYVMFITLSLGLLLFFKLKLFLFFILLIIGGLELYLELIPKHDKKFLNFISEIRKLVENDDPELMIFIGNEMAKSDRRKSANYMLEANVHVFLAATKKASEGHFLEPEEKEEMLNHLNKLEEEALKRGISPKPKMSGREIAIYSALYFLVGGLLYAIMAFDLSVPGVKEAMEVLK